MTALEQRLRLTARQKSRTNSSLTQKFNSGKEKREKLSLYARCRNQESILIGGKP